MNLKKKFVVGAASAALIAGMGLTPAFAVEEPRPLDGGWDRIASERVNNDRIDTALEVARVAFPNVAKAQSVYIANSTAMIDSATAGQLTDGPILLIDNNPRTLDVVKAQVTKYTSANTVYAIGGESVVSDAVLKAVAGDKKTARLGGKDRWETALAVAQRVITVDPAKSKNLMVARADIPVDALAAGPLDHGPVVYVDANGELPEAAKKWVSDHKTTSIIGLGGKDVVPDKALSDANASVIDVNPGKVDQEAIAARKVFEEARALYLGVNRYNADDFTVNKTALAPATSRNPKLLNIVRVDANQRFEGYKALADEVAQRADAVNSAVNSVKTEIANAIKDAAAAGTSAWGTFKADTQNGLGAGGTVNASLAKLYGTTAANAIVTKAEYFVRDADNKVTGVNYGAIESGVDEVKTALKSDASRIKAYFANKDETLLQNGAAPVGYTFDREGVQSSKLFDPNNTIGEMAGSSNTGNNPLVVLQKDTALFLAQAEQNANSTKTSMDEAWAKVKAKQGYTRLGGKDRYETAAMISQYMRLRGLILDRVYLANGDSMVDALVAGAFTRGPILLVNKDGLVTDATKSELQNIGQFKRVFDDRVEERAKGAIPTVLAIGGKNAVADATAAKVAGEIKIGNDKVTEHKTSLLITKQTTVAYSDSAQKKVSNGTTATLTAAYQKDSSLSTSPTVTWQYSADGNAWANVADATPAGVTYSGNNSETLTITGGAGLAGGTHGLYRMLVTYTKLDGTVEQQVASVAAQVDFA